MQFEKWEPVMNLTNRLEGNVPAQVESVDAVCAEVKCRLIADIPKKEQFIIELLLREALLNAVVHGSKDLTDASIHYDIERTADSIRAKVTDRGSGFEWSEWEIPEKTALTSSGHGLQILHLYADSIAFNPMGNEMEWTRKFRKGNVHA
ncbi:MAG: ATP-binding protein [Bryobacterales bacterium]|nr:ATP-binding protein [Bryobacterales bacterium]